MTDGHADIVVSKWLAAPFRAIAVTRRKIPVNFATSCMFCMLFTVSAFASSLGELEIRSYLGQPLNLRVGIKAAADEVLDAACFAIASTANDSTTASTTESTILPRDMGITLVETRAARYLELRGKLGFNEPVAKLSLRSGCKDEQTTTRDYVVLLDPFPIIATPVTTASFSASPESTASAAALASAGQWQVYSGDTLAVIAKGIHPNNRNRRTQYIAALRTLNPSLSGVADDAPLPPDLHLILPDLKVLSGMAPSSAVAVRESTKRTAKVANETPRSEPKASAERPAVPTKSARANPPLPVPRETAVVAPVANRKAPLSATTITPPPSKPPKPTATITIPVSPPVVEAPKKATHGGFQLRLSGSEIDLSRSRGITEEMRAGLREKQLLLDADDQVAQLLSLKNTVKQLELRLNDIQLKMPEAVAASKTTPAPPASAPAPVPTLASTPAVTPTSAPAAAPAPASEPAATLPMPVKATPPAPDANQSAPAAAPATADLWAGWLDSKFFGVPITWLAALLLACIAVMVVLRWLYRRGAEQSTANDDAAALANNNPAISPDIFFAESSGNNDARDGFVATTSYQAATPDDANLHAEAEATAIRDEAELEMIRQRRTGQMPALDLSDIETARFELDTSPSTTVDFLLSGDDFANHDHVRRLQYMFGRYPELASKTVSIDEPDSVINAARLYYEEAKTESARDKACELLTFAIEERPQEIRFWLAQFEIYRLDNLAKEFSELGNKFNVMFGHTDSWPKVRHVGHELDPTNPLFAAAGGASLASDRFDSLAENWLLAPMDFTSDALVGEMRQSLFDDHDVNAADLEKIAATLKALHESATSASENAATSR